MAYGTNLNGITYVFTPTPLANVSLKLQNIGSTPVYVGGFNSLCSPASYGLPLQPGKFLNLSFTPATSPTVYASAGYTAGLVAATASASALTAGSASLSTSTTVPSALVAGTSFFLGKGNTSEVLTVASTAANSTVTFVNPTLYDHVASSLLTLATSVVGQLSVTNGVL